jgi:hypothetical protein
LEDEALKPASTADKARAKVARDERRLEYCMLRLKAAPARKNKIKDHEMTWKLIGLGGLLMIFETKQVRQVLLMLLLYSSTAAPTWAHSVSIEQCQVTVPGHEPFHLHVWCPKTLDSCQMSSSVGTTRLNVACPCLMIQKTPHDKEVYLKGTPLSQDGHEDCKEMQDTIRMSYLTRLRQTIRATGEIART